MDSRYYKKQPNNRMYMYIGDNLARQLDEPYTYVDIRKSKSQQSRLLARKKAQKKERAIMMAFVSICTVLVVGVSALLLITISRTTELAGQISTIESQIDELSVQNDSRKYALESSVDLDYVISVATNELGMVRSSADQIKTYETQDLEYVQQLAEIPTE